MMSYHSNKNVIEIDSPLVEDLQAMNDFWEAGFSRYKSPTQLNNPKE